MPLTEHDRTDDYWWELSMRQVEVSRTLVFDAPRRARAFFEALVADNLDLASLRREKDDASEVREGFECGIVLKNFQDIKIGDVVESFEMREIPRA